MAETTPYFIAIDAARAMAIPEDQYQEEHTISLETQQELLGESVYAYICDNMGKFLEVIRKLSDEDQELLLSYYLLGKTQTALAIVNKSTQTICSTKIRHATKRMGALFFLGDLTHEKITDLLTSGGLLDYPKDPSVTMADVVFRYSELGSAQAVADSLGLYRPDVRRAMTALGNTLSDSPRLDLASLGALVKGMIDKSALSGHGPSKSRMLARGNLYFRDSRVLGQFEIDLRDPGFQDVLYPRANQ